MGKKHSSARWFVAGFLPALLLVLAIFGAVGVLSGRSEPESLKSSLADIPAQWSRVEKDLDRLQNSLLSSRTPSEANSTQEEAADKSITSGEAAQLDELIASFGGGVSVYYKSLTQDDTYTYQADTEYYIASVVKAPYALYVYQLADKGKVDLSQKYPYEARHRQGGSSFFRTQKLGTKFSLSQLLERMIRYSDNDAFMMVREAIPVDGFKAFVRTLGLTQAGSMDMLDDSAAIRGDISAHDAGIIAEAIYRYGESGSPNGEKLKEDMLHTDMPMLRSKYSMARKLGSWEGAMHDVAVIYAPKPYVLAVCTSRGRTYDSWYTDADYEVFIKISERIETFSQN